MERFEIKLLIAVIGLILLFSGGKWVGASPVAGVVSWLAGLALIAWALELYFFGPREA